MKPSALTVVMDTILPPPGDPAGGGLGEAVLRVRDLSMAQNFNSGERDLDDWENLIEGVRPRLKLVRWEQPKGSVLGVLILERYEGGDAL